MMYSQVVKRTILMFLGVLTACYTNASDVFVETDFDVGKGILRPVGDTCFVYTPNHVIENSDSYFISSRHAKDVEASLLTTYPQDLAILQLPSNYVDMCRDSSWKNGERVSAILKGLNKATLSFRRKSGSLTEYPLRISKVDLHTYFYVELEQSNNQIMKGMSGSIVMVGEYPIGMLVSVAQGEGKVIRLDAMADISKSVIESFMTEHQIAAANSSDLSAYPSVSKSSLSVTELSSSPVLGYQTLSGSISQGEFKEYTVFSKGHTAYRFTSAKQGDSVRIRVRFYSPSGNVLYSEDWHTKQQIVDGFGTVDEGEHRLVVEVYKEGSGTYEIKLEEVATPEQLTGEANILEHNGVAKGYVANHTSAVYKVFSKGHTAYRFTSAKQSDSVRIRVRFYSPSGNVLYSEDWHTKQQIVDGFGTVDEGEHYLVVEGYKGSVGTYNIKLEVNE
ncbi:hypothetical protein [Vibrio owensii]|uniref:hypothetical protein n=1 Tax=Vibrio owensii TaxID=696485 RepID=UPI0040694DB9